MPNIYSVTNTLSQEKRPALGSRAVVRTVEPGTCAVCAHCDEPVKFAARAQHRQVIANVYVKGTWNRVEHFHAACYNKAKQPYGPPAA